VARTDPAGISEKFWTSDTILALFVGLPENMLAGSKSTSIGMMIQGLWNYPSTSCNKRVVVAEEDFGEMEMYTVPALFSHQIPCSGSSKYPRQLLLVEPTLQWVNSFRYAAI
jgi:hypothetical protein